MQLDDNVCISCENEDVPSTLQHKFAVISDIHMQIDTATEASYSDINAVNGIRNTVKDFNNTLSAAQANGMSKVFILGDL